MEAFPRRTENRVEGEVVLWGNRRILFLKIFAITDGGSSHYQDVRKAASLCSSYMVLFEGCFEMFWRLTSEDGSGVS